MYEQTQGKTKGRRRSRSGVLLALVGLLAMPSAVRADPLVPTKNLGGGQTMGSITYTGQPMPPVLAACRATTFAFEAASHAFVFNTVISGYVGPVTITGGGTAGCESATVGGGTMTLALTGLNETTKSRLNCPTLVGGYTRVLSDMTLILSGNCVVNQFGQGVVNFVARLQVVPMGGGSGFLAPVASAETSGAFVIAPA